MSTVDEAGKRLAGVGGSLGPNPGPAVGAGDELCPPEDRIFDPQRGIRICRSTGRVISENVISDAPEWRRFPNGDVKGSPRSGSRLSYSVHDLNAGAVVVPRGKAWRDYMRSSKLRRRLAGSRRSRFSPIGGRVRRSERSLVDMITKALILLEQLEIHNVRNIKDVVGQMIHAYYENRKRRGEEARKTVVINEKERWAVAVAAVKKAIRKYNLAIAENEIYEKVLEFKPDFKPEELKNHEWRVLRRMSEYGIDIPSTPSGSIGPRGSRRAVERVNKYVTRLLVNLGLPIRLQVPAMKFLEIALRHGKSLSGRKPEAVAAALVYLIARIHGYDHITQRVVAEEFKLSEANVRKAFRYLLEDMVIVVGV